MGDLMICKILPLDQENDINFTMSENILWIYTVMCVLFTNSFAKIHAMCSLCIIEVCLETLRQTNGGKDTQLISYYLLDRIN